MTLSKYDRNRLKELERKHELGKLEPEMRPYYLFLAGKRDKSNYETEAHLQARKIILRLKKDMTTKQLADHLGVYDSFIQRMIRSEFHNVPEERCREIVEEFG